MTTIRRARRGRTIALAAALVAGSAGSVAMALASPAQAATTTISISNVAYTCTPDIALVSQVLGGPQQVLVKASASVPDQVASGGTIASTRSDLVLTLTDSFVKALKNPDLAIERVRGTATATVNLTGVGTGDAVVASAGAPVNGLEVKDFAELPASGSLDLPASGTIPDVKVPSFDGTAYISMPKVFKIQSIVDPPVLGSIDKVDLTCERNSSDASQRIIGQVTVGDGCPAGGSCAFDASPANDVDAAVPNTPTDPTDDPTSPTANPTSGSGGGTDPIDDGGTDPIDDGGTDTVDTGGFVVGGTQLAPARTVAASDELPATGSPVGWLAFAAVLLLAAGRVGMSLRERRVAGGVSGSSGELGDRPAVRRSLGVAFIGLVLGAVLLTYLVFNDAFSRAVPVTVRTQQAGLDLSAGNDVKVRGVLVGEVASVESSGGEAIVHLALDRDTVGQIPSSVQAVIAPTTLFGQKFVDLQPTNTAVTTPIRADAVIEAAKLPVEIEAVLNDIYPVLEALRPADLSVTINAIAGALDGRGEELGGTIERLSDYLAKLSPLSDQLVDDIVKLGDVADQYADAIPSLGSALGDVAVTSNTIVGRRAQLQALFTNLAGFAGTTENFVRQSGDDYISLVNTGRPTLELLARYAPTIGCVVSGIDRLLPRVEDAFRGQRAHVSLQLAPRSASGYTTDEAPRLPSLSAPDSPTCRSLPASPYNANRTAPGIPGSVLQQFGIDADHHKTAAGSTFTGDDTADTTGLSRSMGNVGSVADRQAVDAVVGASTGRAVGDASGLAALTVGSSLRGSEVTFQ